MKDNLSVILIAHNEEQTIGGMLDGLLKHCEKETLELIVVDDASTDQTSAIVQARASRNSKVKLVRRIPPCGVGRALKAGFSNISPKADYVLSMDSDFIMNIREVRSLIQAIEEKGYDGVIGSRFIKGSRLYVYPAIKRIMNRLFHLVVKALFHIKQNDLTNNFKLYRACIFRNLPWESNDYSINAETGLLPIIAGYRIGEIPVSWFGRDNQMGKSKFSIFRYGWGYVRVIFYAFRFLRSKIERCSDYIPKGENLLSVVILAKNEEERIAECLDSVKWTDEIIVVDDESNDKTAQIARRYTERVYVKKMDLQGRHRNWAYSQAKNRWVLSLDADEVVTAELRDEIIKTLASNPIENGFTIPRRNYIGDYWLRYGGLYPSSQLKLFKNDKFKFEEAEVHCRAFMDEPCGHLKSDILHHTYRDYDDFVNKLNRQTSWEAKKWFRQGRPMRRGRFIWRAWDRFMRTYIVKHGYRDGFMGFVVAFNAALYQIISYLKYREILILEDEGKKR